MATIYVNGAQTHSQSPRADRPTNRRGGYSHPAQRSDPTDRTPTGGRLLVAEGMTNGETAARLFASDATVNSHITSVLRRLGTPAAALSGHLRQQHHSADLSPHDLR
ncbi:helix-turn-helix domain-containing protein [Micromonospora sp. DT81.3]|uniref:helix-turn-helix domain-containing protein n=1 Tax=Micromonospora sp. DT81.3 TaxID=3416523 RepID=UPI003CFB3A96